VNEKSSFTASSAPWNCSSLHLEVEKGRAAAEKKREGLRKSLVVTPTPRTIGCIVRSNRSCDSVDYMCHFFSHGCHEPKLRWDTHFRNPIVLTLSNNTTGVGVLGTVAQRQRVAFRLNGSICITELSQHRAIAAHNKAIKMLVVLVGVTTS
jgi:hypothetical protein